MGCAIDARSAGLIFLSVIPSQNAVEISVF